MFAPRYFAPRYFAPRYWPPGFAAVADLITPDVYYKLRDRRITARALYHDLIARYGPADGRRIYTAMQAEGKGPFAPGKKYGPRRRRNQG